MVITVQSTAYISTMSRKRRAYSRALDPFARRGWITSPAFDDKLNTIFFKAAALSYIPRFEQKSQCPPFVAAVCAAIAAPLRVVCYVPAVLKRGYSRTSRILLNDSIKKESTLLQGWIRCLDIFASLIINFFFFYFALCIFSDIFELLTVKRNRFSMEYAICKMYRVHR